MAKTIDIQQQKTHIGRKPVASSVDWSALTVKIWGSSNNKNDLLRLAENYSTKKIKTKKNSNRMGGYDNRNYLQNVQKFEKYNKNSNSHNNNQFVKKLKYIVQKNDYWAVRNFLKEVPKSFDIFNYKPKGLRDFFQKGDTFLHAIVRYGLTSSLLAFLHHDEKGKVYKALKKCLPQNPLLPLHSSSAS